MSSPRASGYFRTSYARDTALVDTRTQKAWLTVLAVALAGYPFLAGPFALDLATHGIRSNVIAPTFIETPLTRPMLEDATFKASVLAKIKLGRLGQVEDLMGPVVFLASDAASYITGQTLAIDGGLTWEVVATNNSVRSQPGSTDAELPNFASVSSREPAHWMKAIFFASLPSPGRRILPPVEVVVVSFSQFEMLDEPEPAYGVPTVPTGTVAPAWTTVIGTRSSLGASSVADFTVVQCEVTATESSAVGSCASVCRPLFSEQ